MSTEALGKINPLMTACIFIEYQNEFTTEGGALYDSVKDCMNATGTLENSRKFMDECRDAGCTIIHVPISYDKVRIR
jgi:nicotinamidase-related amidase